MKRRSKCTAFLIVALALLLACALLAGCESKVTLKLVTYDGNFTVLEGKAGEIADFPAVTRDGYALEGWYEDESFVGQPVGQAVFEKDKTYYAKWVKTYAVTFELDGGAMETASVFLPEGKGLLAALDGLVPVKGEYRFGGWYINGRALAESDKMPASDVVLTAKYMAEYKINVYLQELNLADYAFEEGYSSGYALIGEEFSPELSVKGFSLSGGAEQSRVIDADSSENVFELRFDRNSYGLWFVSNYPDGSGRNEEELAYTYLYGEEIDFPKSVPFEADGYRFFGWGAYTNSDFDEAIEEENFEDETDAGEEDGESKANPGNETTDSNPAPAQGGKVLEVEGQGNGVRVEDLVTQDMLTARLEALNAKLNAVIDENKALKDKYENPDFGNHVKKGAGAADNPAAKKAANESFEEYSKQFM
mgnify:CR=1 FL=1